MKPIKPLLDSLSAPLGDLIAEMGRGVADAQQALDEATLEQLQRIYAEDEALLEQLRALGYQPTWYQIPEAEGEIRVALSVEGQHSSSSGRRRLRLFGAPLNAGYQNRFDYQLEASSRLKFRIVPIPAPSVLEDKRVVPRLVGKTLAEAGDLLATLDIAFETSPKNLAEQPLAVVQASEPAAGELLDVEQNLRLTVARSA